MLPYAHTERAPVESTLSRQFKAAKAVGISVCATIYTLCTIASVYGVLAAIVYFWFHTALIIFA